MRAYDISVGAHLLLCAVQLAMLGYAAWRDARTRTFPNALAAPLAVVCAALAFTGAAANGNLWEASAGELVQGAFLPHEGLRALAENAAAAVAVTGALLLFELAWRHRRREPGLGIGDLKYLFALMLATPFPALASFAFALILLALCGMLTHNQTLPLLPFAVPSYLATLLLL